MRTFTRIVETGRLSAAARARGLSVAAVSRQLDAMERDLGATLILRSTRRLSVTDSGHRWYQHCTRMLDELATARADVAESGEVRGAVVVSAPITFGLVHIAPRLARLARAHPLLEIDLRLEDHAIDLVGDGVDVAVRTGMTLPDSSSVIARPIARYPRVAMASAAYLRRRGTPKHPSELAGHDLLLQSRAAPALARWQFTRAGETVEIAPHGRMGSRSPVVLRDWAAAGAGIALLPEWLLGDLRRVLPAWSSPPIEAWAIHRVELRGAARIRATLEAFCVPPIERMPGPDPA